MDAIWTEVLRLLDLILISPYRLAGNPLVNFFVGSTCLAMGCVVLGELTLSLAIRFNRQHIDRLNQEITRQELLSVHAYNQGDRAGYRALNQAANDAWGKHFFTMAAYSAGMLWPVPFSLAWMHTRFQAVTFDLVQPLAWIFGDSVSYAFVYIPLYILCRMVFGRLRAWLPYFRGVQRMLDAAAR
jgi:hypothetical protein